MAGPVEAFDRSGSILWHVLRLAVEAAFVGIVFAGIGRLLGVALVGRVLLRVTGFWSGLVGGSGVVLFWLMSASQFENDVEIGGQRGFAR